MSKRIPKSIWLITLFVAVVLGILVGIALPQNTFITLFPLVFGWVFLPSIGWSLPGVDEVTHVPQWFLWLVVFYYPLATLIASVCAYWTLWATENRRQALLVVGLFVCVSILVCVPVSLVAPSLNSNGTTFAVSLTTIIPVVLNLLFSAGLGWCIGWLIPKPKRGMIS
ncbi:hypothetical protein [Ktedonospora formicarum]|uniref:hypothetical protein n=1 Tax=Ktedonospora formicarum TaxID=2778364 RepID=UPI001C68C964|nr:hypothetical protein [Ktedonospora formicarum]